jgi:hypothetical protein
VFVLMREISAYTGPDVLLGVFATDAEANGAKAYYARVREANPAADPWKDQAIKPNVVVREDLAVKRLRGNFLTGTPVFVVSDYKEGFGQIVRKLDSIHATLATAEAREEELDKVQAKGFPFPHYALVDPVVVGKLHSDLPEDQPHLMWRVGPNRALHLTAKRLFRDVKPA